jgi:endogenous inhibitor of DNA gyrase (YacG/DUF329 family)
VAKKPNPQPVPGTECENCGGKLLETSVKALDPFCSRECCEYAHELVEWDGKKWKAAA